MFALLLACATEAEDTAYVPHASDTTIEFVGPKTAECVDDTLHLQVGFDEKVGMVEAEVRIDDGDYAEFHELPYGGLDKDTESVHLYDIELHTDADESDGNHTTFSCDQAPVAGFRVYDEDMGTMACYFGDFVAEWFDPVGCPE